jgi:hypothetical protein
MVSWNRAFRGAAGVVGFSIIWWFIGSLLVAGGFFVSGWGITSGFFEPGIALFSMIVSIILIVLGSIIGILGTVAAVLKILPEMVAEEITSA